MKPRAFIVAGIAVLASNAALAESGSSSPYIDSVKAEMSENGDSAEPMTRTREAPSPYIDAIRSKVGAAKHSEVGGGYIEKMKSELGESSSKGYTDELKTRLEPTQSSSAIQAVREGRSDLHARKEGEIHHAAGLRVGASLARDISSSTASQSFESVYGANAPLDFDLFYEYQPWHSEWIGTLGFFGDVGVAYYHGNGAFQFQVAKADGGGGNFGTGSQTKFQFFTVPVTLGVDLRFNFMRLLRPFAMVGATTVGFYENRDDGKEPRTATSFGVYLSGGVNILLDWVSAQSSWELYDAGGIKHYYLTVAYNQIATFAGDVSFSVSGLYGGFTFEF